MSGRQGSGQLESVSQATDDQSGAFKDRPGLDATPGTTSTGIIAKLAIWQSPTGQPGWARPALLAIATLAGATYVWGISNLPLEPFYGAAVRSMGANWSDFFFGAVDPNGTVSLDKLPGAFWVQALFVRVFGFHFWVVALPQAIAGVLTILVLYRVVRRLVGPKAGVLAALIMAVSPVTALVNRGNVSDSWFVLLAVLAADATVKAIVTGRLASLLLASLWVGLAFQTKMLQAWLIIPALFFAYLVAGSPDFGHRVKNVLVAGATVVVVSLSWMTVVAIVPAHDRPYVDGTSDNSIYTQVFIYNGSVRLGIRAGSNLADTREQPYLKAIQVGEPEFGTNRIRPSFDRLLIGPLGRDDAWLLPAAFVSVVGVLFARRRASRRDLLRAGVILWGSWLAILLIVFSRTTPINSYYTAALIPPIAGLCVSGLTVCWRTRISSRISRVLLLIVVPLTTAYAVTLVPASSGVAYWVYPLVVVVGIGAELTLFVSLRDVMLSDPAMSGIAILLATLSMLLVPAIATIVVVADGLGAFSTPFQSTATNTVTTALPERYQSGGAKVAAEYGNFPKSIVIAAVDTTAIAAPLIMATGREFLPIGGYLGSNPAPTLARLQSMVSSNQVEFFFIPVAPVGSDARLAWVRAHCALSFSHRENSRAVFGTYDCLRRPS